MAWDLHRPSDNGFFFEISKGMPGVDIIPKKFPPFNLLAGEIFKISGGQIHEIEANGDRVPYGAKSGWDDK